ncbi:RNA-directed DNA polymerase, eukaryota, reverse transcriptase zinc-binding domain protein [Tanacetum coccineum]
MENDDSVMHENVIEGTDLKIQDEGVVHEVENESCNGEKGNEDIALNVEGHKGVFGNTEKEGKEVHTHTDFVCNTPKSLMFKGKSSDDVNVESVNGDSNDNVPKQNSYALMVKMDDIPKNLEFIPIVITETGDEVVIFDEEIVKKGSEKWCLTVCGQFVGYEMHISMNAVIDKGPWMVKNKPLFVQKWNPKIGISALASSLGKPIVIDPMTASTCHKGIGNISYVRVFVEMDVAKDLKNETEIHYVDSSKNIKGSKKVQVVYDWKPPMCSHCRVFGHEIMKCKNGGVISKDSKEVQNDGKLNDIPEEQQNRNNEFVTQGRKRVQKNDYNKPGNFINHNMHSHNQVNEAWRMNRKKHNEAENMKGKENETDNDQEIRTLKERMVVDRKKWKKKNVMEDVMEVNNCTAKIMRDNEINELWWDGMLIERRYLWEELIKESRYVNGNPWSITGDMNVTLKPGEHSCGSSGMTSDMMEFQECLNKIEVEEFYRTGLQFTWTKNLQKTKAGSMTGILKKLYRVMSNEGFIKQFSNPHAKFLPYIISDHTPSILCIPTSIKKKTKAFRFSNFLTEKQEFLHTVKDKWSKDVHGYYMYQVTQKLKSLKIPLNKLGWSKGNLFKRVETLGGQLQKVQTDIDNDPHNHTLIDIEAKLVKEFYEAEEDEEKFLFQQAKIKWLSDGDKNRSYFHKVLKGRNNRSKIQSLTDEAGISYESDQIPQLFLKHFEEFLGKSQLVQEIEDCGSLFKRRISDEAVERMIADVSDKEIKKAMFEIDDTKAPGPDGFTAKAWSIIGTDVCKAVREFFMSGRMLAGFTLNVNGERTGYNKGGRGLRQGDPIQIKKDSKFQYHFGCKSLKLIHVCFADDLLVMSHGDTNSVQVIKRTLDEFSACSGLLPNNSKSTVFFGSLCEEERNAITNVLPFATGKLPVRYLGVPLIAKRLSVKDCGSLLDKIKSMVKN